MMSLGDLSMCRLTRPARHWSASSATRKTAAGAARLASELGCASTSPSFRPANAYKRVCLVAANKTYRPDTIAAYRRSLKHGTEARTLDFAAGGRRSVAGDCVGGAGEGPTDIGQARGERQGSCSRLGYRRNPDHRGPAKAAPITDDTADEKSSTAQSSEGTESGVEVIRERHPNTAVKVERHVTQDAEGNYYNHGLWTEWDEKGRLVGSGEYRYGKRHGRWLRWYGPNEAPMLQGALYKDFQAPFVAEATFEDGVLNGTWKVFDSKNRKVSEWEFDHGERQRQERVVLPQRPEAPRSRLSPRSIRRRSDGMGSGLQACHS